MEKDGDKYYRMDVLWHYFCNLKSGDGRPIFKRLSKIAMLVLTIPHSNADEEVLFSMVRNKTPFRQSLGLDKTLPSLLTVKLATEEPCHKFEPHPSVVARAKSHGNTTKNTGNLNLCMYYCNKFPSEQVTIQ